LCDNPEGIKLMRKLIIADRAIDGVGGVLDDVALTVDDRGIIELVEQGHDGLSSFSGTVVDMRGHTLLPGLVDGHVHLNLPADGSTFEQAMSESDEYLAVASASAATRALNGGVTTVRDLGGRRMTTFAARRAMDHEGRSARMLLSGPSLTITGGHCRYFGGEADGVEGVRRAVRQRVGEGADWIKVIGSGGGTPNTLSHRASFTLDEVRAIVEEAHRLDTKVTMHCLCAEAMENAVTAGVDGIEHGWFLVGEGTEQRFSQAVAEKIAEAGIVVASTLSVGHFILEAYRDRTDLDSDEVTYVEGWKRAHEFNLELCGRLLNAGVSMIGGTDAGWRFTPFDAMPVEVGLLSEAGMRPAEAVAACTGRAAGHLLGAGAPVGRLAGGFEADIVGVEGNPLQDVSQLRHVRMIMRSGRIHRGPTGLRGGLA